MVWDKKKRIDILWGTDVYKFVLTSPLIEFVRILHRDLLVLLSDALYSSDLAPLYNHLAVASSMSNPSHLIQ